MRIPVYQMCLSLDEEEKPGLVFPSEYHEDGNQSVLYAVPLLHAIHHPFDIIDFFHHQSIYFPFELNGEYFELEAKINFPELTFKVPKVNINITFVVDNESHSGWWNIYPYNRNSFGKLKYIGKNNKIIRNNFEFIYLMPVDLFEMDVLYIKHKGIFVGLTPQFGNQENMILG